MTNKIFLIFIFLAIDFVRNEVTTFDLIDSVKNEVTTFDSIDYAENKVTTIDPIDYAENKVTTIDPIDYAENKVTTIDPTDYAENEVTTIDPSTPSIIKEITFYKDKKTIDGNNQLNCINLIDNGYCEKYSLNSVTCKMIDNKFICDSSDLKLLITFYDYNGWCKKETPSSSKLPYKYYKDTCYLKYSLTVNWLTIVGIVIVILIFLPCIIGMLFYGLLILNMKIRRNRSSDRDELIDDNHSENIY